jgi:hypothetical protein
MRLKLLKGEFCPFSTEKAPSARLWTKAEEGVQRANGFSDQF